MKVMAPLAHRATMTEGQLYTAVIAVLAVILLTLTGLPDAAERETRPAPTSGSIEEVVP